MRRSKVCLNTAFHLARHRQPAASSSDRSVDCVISNCVINLAPDKPAVFREIHRVLKPGGRLAVSDIALKKPLPAELGDDLMAYIGCIGGAVPIEDYERDLRAAGFDAVQVVDSRKDLRCLCIGREPGRLLFAADEQGRNSAGGRRLLRLPMRAAAEGVHEGLAGLLRKYDVNAYAASVRVYAVKIC